MNATPAVPGLTPAVLAQRTTALAAMVEGDGIVAGADAEGRPQPLRVDPGPLVIDAQEWGGAGAGTRPAGHPPGCGIGRPVRPA
ncbi:hypothetical protein [Propioniciclava flava]